MQQARSYVQVTGQLHAQLSHPTTPPKIKKQQRPSNNDITQFYGLTAGTDKWINLYP